MELISQYFSGNFIDAIVWAIFHSIWQAALISLFTVLLLRQYEGKSAIKYRIAMSALLAVFVCAVATFLQYYSFWTIPATSPYDFSDEGLMVIVSPNSQNNVSAISQGVEGFQSYFPLIFCFWVLGMILYALRLVGGLVFIQYIRKTRLWAVSEYWQRQLVSIKEELGIRIKVVLKESGWVNGPVLVGYFKPMILLPIGTINALSTEEVEAILAHELAHLYRHDYLLNLLQTFIEILLFYNPAVWFIAGHIRSEREHACDDIAVKICGSSIVYAKALLKTQEQLGNTTNLAMNFAGPKNQLLNRIRHILNQPKNHSNMIEKLVATSLLGFTLLIMSVATSSPVEELKDFKGDISPAAPEVKLDTLPKGKIWFEMDKDGQKVAAKLNDGKIVDLEIDGKKIPDEEFADYEPMVEELISEIPPPPPPPPAPTPPSPPSVPSEPTVPGAIPAPPSPPSPPSPGKYHATTIKTESAENGNVIIILDGEDGEEIKIEVEEDGGKVLLNGKTLEEGEEAIILEKGGTGFYEFPAFPEFQNIYFLDTTWENGANAFYYSLDNWGDDELYFPKEEYDAHINSILEEQKAKMNEQAKKMEALENEMQAKLENVNLRRQELMAQMQKAYQEKQKLYVKKLELYHSRGSSFNDYIEKELFADGLIQPKENYEFILSTNKLTINGVKQSAELHEKYLELYESTTGNKLDKKSSFRIEKDYDAGYNSTRME